MVKKVDWHAYDIQDVFSRLNADDQGLTELEAKKRIEKYGYKRLCPPKGKGMWLRILEQFNNVLIYILLIAAVITGLLAHWADAGVILSVVIINAVIGLMQEGKAEKAIDAIRNMLSPTAVVIRDGKRSTISADCVVKGDIMSLQAGDQVRADLRLFYTKR